MQGEIDLKGRQTRDEDEGYGQQVWKPHFFRKPERDVSVHHGVNIFYAMPHHMALFVAW